MPYIDSAKISNTIAIDILLTVVIRGVVVAIGVEGEVVVKYVDTDVDNSDVVEADCEDEDDVSTFVMYGEMVGI